MGSRVRAASATPREGWAFEEPVHFQRGWMRTQDAGSGATAVMPRAGPGSADIPPPPEL